ncbi:3-hydroxybutyryl-CoA dehydrogenase [Raineyella antarctica]|uniref:3-hydroxybutyryl-CoA dehydrogenase n=1 Tax=Raineyella antarctica TaxID=1577474 RepID=A0A1G6GI58_9ACTN|nr:3-hydroxybutyryl-CoA dehydrogenase [Raineyella antarctica]SDB81589.1 3-hydroxybutyryl-CoA dehydrogenase [Raineyella antarctica]
MSIYEHVGVVGSGTMGRGIAESILRSGARVSLYDTRPAALADARASIERNLAKSVQKGQAEATDAAAWLEALTLVDSPEGLAGPGLVIEAVPEVLQIKLEVLRAIEAVVGPEAVIASNTSSIPITRLAEALERPERFLGLHFFNPVPRMGLAEVITPSSTRVDVTEQVRRFVAEQLAKTPIVVEDRPGFVVNFLLVPYLLSAMRMHEQGYASAEDIDAGMRLGCGHPMGPLQLSDLIGLDVVAHIGDAIHSETGDPAFLVPDGLRRMLEAGCLGKKSGSGFYDYSTTA